MGSIVKKITVVNNCHSTVTPSFFVINLYYHANYSVKVVSNTPVIYCGILTLEKVNTTVNKLIFLKHWSLVPMV